jgi:hypothetical protein
MFTIDYFNFTLKYPAYLNLPYVEQEVSDKIDEVLMIYPMIEECLPESVRMLAVKYGIEDLYCLECEDGSFGVIEEQKSRNDSVKYSLAAAGNVMVNRLWAKRLQGLLKSYGCYHKFGKVVNCPPAGCGCS